MKLNTLEKQICQCIVNGDKRSAIASALKLAVGTVDYHLFKLRMRFGAVSTSHLAVRLLRTKTLR